MSEDFKLVSSNKKAFHDYTIQEKIELGIVLTGTEVKSLREGRCNLKDSYARIKNNELWLIGMHISTYKNEGYVTHDPERVRKLLIQKRELKRLYRQVQEKGITLIPLRIYFKKGWAKAEIGLAAGKRQYDKRQDIARRQQKRDQDRLEKKYRIK